MHAQYILALCQHVVIMEIVCIISPLYYNSEILSHIFLKHGIVIYFSYFMYCILWYDTNSGVKPFIKMIREHNKHS